MTTEENWERAFARWLGWNEPKRFAELLRQEAVPAKIQSALADILDPKDKKLSLPFEITASWDKQALRKLKTFSEQLKYGAEITRISKKRGKLDAAVLELESEGKSRAYLYEAAKKANLLREGIREFLSLLSRDQLREIEADPSKLLRFFSGLDFDDKHE